MPTTLAIIKPQAVSKGYAPAIEARMKAQHFSIIARAEARAAPGVGEPYAPFVFPWAADRNAGPHGQMHRPGMIFLRNTRLLTTALVSSPAPA